MKLYEELFANTCKDLYLSNNNTKIIEEYDLSLSDNNTNRFDKCKMIIPENICYYNIHIDLDEFFLVVSKPTN